MQPSLGMQSTGELQELVHAFSNARVAVLGDLICDRFVYGDVERISPEAPVPVVRVRSEGLKVGGAGNVAHNVLTLGGRVSTFGVVGKDAYGDFLISELQRLGADTSGVFIDDSRITTLKTRVMSASQHLLRIDSEITDPIEDRFEGTIASALERASSICDILVISDYAKGVLTPSLTRKAIDLFKQVSKKVICDPKPANLPLFKGIDLITPNRDEALRSAGINRVESDSLERSARWIREQLSVGAVMITAGADGIFLLENDSGLVVPAERVEVYDVVGAGDTVCATLALALSAGADLITSAKLANICAGIVVGKLGLATVSKDELLNVIASKHSPAL